MVAAQRDSARSRVAGRSVAAGRRGQGRVGLRGTEHAAAVGRHPSWDDHVRWTGRGDRPASGRVDVGSASHGSCRCPRRRVDRSGHRDRSRPARECLPDGAPDRHISSERVHRQLQRRDRTAPTPFSPASEPTARSRSTPTPPPTSSSTSPATSPPGAPRRCSRRCGWSTLVLGRPRPMDRTRGSARERQGRRWKCKSRVVPVSPPTRRPQWSP